MAYPDCNLLKPEAPLPSQPPDPGVCTTQACFHHCSDVGLTAKHGCAQILHHVRVRAVGYTVTFFRWLRFTGWQRGHLGHIWNTCENTLVSSIGVGLTTKHACAQMLHQSRVKAAPARQRRAAGLLERLRRENSFYATPFGSNDDWYWLYAAVKSGDQPSSAASLPFRTAVCFPRYPPTHMLRSDCGFGVQ